MPKADICHDLCVVTTRMLTSETSSLFDSDGEAVGGYRDACALRGARTSKKISTLNDKARSGRAYVGEVDASEKCGEVPEVVNGSGEYLERTIGQRSSGARKAACAEMRGAYSGLVLWHGRFWGAGLPLLSLCRSASAEPWWKSGVPRFLHRECGRGGEIRGLLLSRGLYARKYQDPRRQLGESV